MSDNDELITLRAYSDPLQAHADQGLLATHDIETFIADQHVAGVLGQLAPIVGQVRLQVRRGDAERASRTLSSVKGEPAAPAAAPEPPRLLIGLFVLIAVGVAAVLLLEPVIRSKASAPGTSAPLR